MVDVYILDDNIEFLHHIKIIVEKIIFINNYDARLKIITDNLDDILSNIESNSSIFILDIELNGKINGIELANNIKSVNQNSYIVYLTAFSQYIYESINKFTRPSEYILKSDFQSIGYKLNGCFEKIFKELEISKINDYISIKTLDKIYILDLKAILYFITCEDNKDKVNVYTKTSFYTFKSTKKALMNRLNSDFIRINNSTIINKNNVKFIDLENKMIVLIDDYKFYFSRKYIKKSTLLKIFNLR